MLDELATVRASRIALNRGETIPELFGVASPIVNGSAVTMAIGLAGPAARMAAAKMDDIAWDVQEAARGLENPLTSQG